MSAKVGDRIKRVQVRLRHLGKSWKSGLLAIGKWNQSSTSAETVKLDLQTFWKSWFLFVVAKNGGPDPYWLQTLKFLWFSSGLPKGVHWFPRSNPIDSMCMLFQRGSRGLRWSLQRRKTSRNLPRMRLGAPLFEQRWFKFGQLVVIFARHGRAIFGLRDSGVSFPTTIF